MSSRKKLYPLLLKLFTAAVFVFSSTLLSAAGFYGNQGNDPGCSYGSAKDSLTCQGLANDSLKRFIRYDHDDGVFSYYSVRLSMFISYQERGYFYEAARSAEIPIMDKKDIDKDSALFMTGNTDMIKTLLILSDLYDQTINRRPALSLAGTTPIPVISAPLPGIPATCETALVSCSGNSYTFPANSNTNYAPPPILGYPDYGCLGSGGPRGPSYYYMQVSVAGNIIIHMSAGFDVDFICWGPFSSVSTGCAMGLTGTCKQSGQPGPDPICCNNTDPGCLYPKGNIVDCSYSGNWTEDCHINNAQVGEIYILLISNFSGASGGIITFSQTGGTGQTDCNIVLHCSMIALTANASACDPLTNTFSISGNIEFSNPPPTGTLTITDNTAVPPVSQTFSPPFVSPKPYNLTGITCNGILHNLTAAFSDSVTCTLNQDVNSPPVDCPAATISGGGAICSGGSPVWVNIDITGVWPFNFTYAINGVNQTPVVNFNGSAYVFPSTVPGTYTLVSLSNSVCASGVISGTAIITLNPIPSPTVIGPAAVCAGTTGSVYSSQPGMTNYTWVISGAGTVTAGGTATDNTVTVTWNTPGAQTVSINYHDGNGCIAPAAYVFPVTVNSLPIPAITGNINVCAGTTGVVYTTQPGMTNYSWTVSAGGITTAGGTATDNTVTVTWNGAGAQTVSVNFNDANTCRASSPTIFPVTVHALPVPAITGSNVVCAGTTGVIYSTQAGNSIYQWAISGGGTITSGGTATDNTVTVTWNTAGAQTVSVNFHDINGCTAVTSTNYNVTVNPLPAPTIGGLTSVCLNSSSTYTTEAGMTGYSWSVSAGGTITAGAGTNTVTINWNSVGPKIVSVNYLNGFTCTAPSATTWSVTVNPLPNPSLTGTTSICTGFSATYTTDAGMTNYTWLASPGGTVTSGGGINNNTVTILWTTVGAQSVSVNYFLATGCTAGTPTILGITVNPLPAVTIAGNPVLCAGSTGVVYSTQPAMTNYSWTVSPGASITSGGNATDNSVTVTWNTPGPQSVTVNYVNGNGCTALAPTVFPVTVNPLPVPAIAGPASVCLNSTGTYSTATGMTNYTWTVSPGGSITSGSGTSTITVLWTTTGPNTITVNFNDLNGCTAPVATSYPVTVNLLPVPALAGLNQICVGNSTTYTTDAGMTNYSWNKSAGGSIVSGGSVTDNTVTILWNGAGPQTVSVNYVMGTGCTAPSPTIFNVTVHSLPVPTLAGTNVLCAGTAGTVYTTQLGMTNYSWTVSPGGTVTAGGTIVDHTVTITWNIAGAQSVSVNFNDVNGCTALSPVIYPVTVNALPVPTLAGPVSVCLNSTSMYFTDPGMTNYLWSVSAGATITAGTGSNSITVLWNTTGNKTITVNYADIHNCFAAIPSSYSVNVSNLPSPSLTGLNSICTGNSVVYSSDAGMTGYAWSVSAGGTLTAGGGPADNTATVTWNNSGAQTISVNYQVGPGCMAALPTILNITVKPRPAVTNATNSSVCSATTLNIVPQADLLGTTFSWVATGSSANITGFSSGNGFTISDHLINIGSSIETVTYAVLPSLNGCDGAVSNYVVTVYPVPDVTFTPNGQTFCSGSTSNISLTSLVAGTTYTWTANGSSGNVTGFGPGAGNSISQTLTNSGFVNETVTYFVLPHANGCPGTITTVVIVIAPIPVVTFTPCTDIITTTDAKPFTLRGGLPLGGTYSGLGANAGIFYPSLAGAGIHTISYSYTSTNSCSSNAFLNISVMGALGFSCDNMMTDIRDNTQYPTVKIGTQCWMATNLNYGNIVTSNLMQGDNCTFEKYCFSDQAPNCSSMGGLYQWDEVMKFETTEGIQGLCPPAWHVPAESEWTQLFNFYTSNGFAGSALKTGGFSGFNAFLDGVRFDNTNWYFSNFATFFWSSTAHTPTKAWAHALNNFNPSVSYYPGNRSNAFFVRCIKD